ncbi:hypothetical protein FJ366_03220 [Candidatus Dependentiae bacterium]|nr:hypothetical protein [Candidatus Dependentiae bacterium]
MFGISWNLNNQTVRQFLIFFQLLRRDLYIVLHILPKKIINTVVWSSAMIFANHYIMPLLGLPAAYGKFMLVGAITVQMLFQSMADVAVRVSDLVGDREILFALGLPIPAWLVCARYATTTMIQGIMSSFFALPAAVLIMWGDFSFPYASLPKIALMVFSQGMFFGAFSLFMTAGTKNMPDYENAWMRIANPLLILGCYTFSWSVLKKAIPFFAPLFLLNPFTYLMEGIRASVLGQFTFINYWTCELSILMFTLFFAVQGFYRLKKRLDFV